MTHTRQSDEFLVGTSLATQRPAAVRGLRLLPAVVGVACLVGTAACSGSPSGDSTSAGTSSSPSASGPAPTIAPVGGFTVADKTASPSKVFGDTATNPFLLDITQAPVATDSDAKIANLMGQITPHYAGIVAFNAYENNSTFFVADEKTPVQRITFDNCQKKDQEPTGLYRGPKIFANVPIPPEAIAAKGTDQAITIWSPAQDKLWEFWVFTKPKNKNDTYSACWGGRIDDVSKSKGSFPFPYGSSASGLSTAGTMISVAEGQKLQIDHAMTLMVIQPATHKKVEYPANRSDGNNNDPAALPMGTRLRLPAGLDVESLQITPIAKAMARAAQKYGFIVTETSGAVAVPAQSALPMEIASGKNPWDATLRGVPPYSALKGFPWDKLEVVQPSYGKPAS